MGPSTSVVFLRSLLWLLFSNVSPIVVIIGETDRNFSAIGYSLWAKDIVFVVSDGYLEGMHAWLAAYHGLSQSSKTIDA